MECIYVLFWGCLFFRGEVKSIEIVFRFFLGKILEDDTALKEYKINDKNFVVVLPSKVRRVHFILVFGRSDSAVL